MNPNRKNTRKARAQESFIEKVPATLRIPQLPRLGRDALEARSLSGIRPQEFFSRPTTLEEAEANRESAINKCVARHMNGDASGLGELLEIAKEFGHDPRFVDAMADVMIAQRVGRRLGGRPKGVSRSVLQRRLGIGCVVDALRDVGIRPEEIFEAMERRNFECLTDRVRRRDYFEARRHPAMQAQLFRREDQRRILRSDARIPGGCAFEINRIRIEGPLTIPRGLRLNGSITRSATGAHIHLWFE